MSGIVIDVDTRTEKAKRDLDAIKASVAGIQSTTSKAAEAMLNLAKGLAAIATSGLAFSFLAKASSQYTDIGNKIALVTGRTNDLIYSQMKLRDITEKTRSSIEGSVSIFSTFGKALKSSGVSTDQLLKVTETIQKAITISGSSAESAASAIIQLGQGIASNTLRGEELNSVLEQTPRIAQAIADSMNLQVGQLRKVAEEGKLSGTSVFQGILSQSEKINKEFSQVNPTLNQGITLLSQSISEFVAELDIGLGISGSIGGLLLRTASNIRGASQNIATDAYLFLQRFRSGLAVVESVVKPIITIILELGKQLIKALPQGFFTRTFISDAKEGLRTLDDITGGAFTSISRIIQFGIKDLIDWDSNIERAFKKIKRIGPDVWLTGGWDSQTIKRFFSVETLRLYGEAFSELSDAIIENTTSWWPAIGNFVRRFEYALQDLDRYIGGTRDTLLTFRFGNMDNLLYSIVELARGMTGIQMQFTNLWNIVREILGPTIIRVQIMIEDLVLNLPIKLYKAILLANALVTKALIGLGQIISDFFKVSFPAIELPRFNGSVILEEIKKFAEVVIEFFKEIYDKVVGHSYWPDTMNAIEDFGKRTFKNVISATKDFVEDIESSFKLIFSKVNKLSKAIESTPFTPFANLLDSAGSRIIRIISSIANSIDWFITILTFELGVPVFISMIIRYFSLLTDLFDNRTPLEKFTDKIKTAIRNLSYGLQSIGKFESYLLYLYGKLKLDTDSAGTAIGYTLQKNILKEINKLDNYQFPWNNSTFNIFKRNFLIIFTEILLIAVSVLDIVAIVIYNFSKNIINYFKDIYDKVVGHSWWTDTMNGVVDQANKLTGRVSVPLTKFKDFIKSIFSKQKLADLDFSFKFASGKFEGIYESLKEAVAKAFKVAMADAATIIRTAITGLGAVLALLFLPNSTIRFAIVAWLTYNFVESILVVSDRFSEIFGVNFSRTLGKSLGKITGEWVISFAKDIPEILKAITSVIVGFTQGFLQSLPAIGSAIKALFSIGNFLGTTGAFGIIGIYLFGNSLLSFLNVGFAAIIRARVMAPLLYLQAFASGQRGGFVFQWLFGAMGIERVYAGMAAAATLLGAFDGILGDSKVLKVFAASGALYVLLFGQTGVQHLINLTATTIANLRGIIGRAVATQFGATQIGALIANTATTINWSSISNALLSGQLGILVNSVRTQLLTYAAQGVSFMTVMLFGTNTQQTLDLIKAQFMVMYTFIITQIGKLRTFIVGTNLFSSMFGDQSMFGQMKASFSAQLAKRPLGYAAVRPPVAPVPPIVPAYTAMQSVPFYPPGGINYVPVVQSQTAAIAGMAAVNTTAAAASAANLLTVAKIGPLGIIGNAILGKTGRMVLIGLALATFVGIAAAATSSQGEIKQYTYTFREFLDTIKTFATDNPFAFWTIAITTVSIPLILVGLWKIRMEIARTIGAAAAFSVMHPFQAFGIMLKELWIKLAFTSKAFTILGIAAIATFAGMQMSGGSLMEVLIGVASIGVLLGSIWTGLGLTLAGVETALAAISLTLLGVVGFVAGLATLFLGGFFLVYFFGEGDSFSEKLNSIWHKIKEIIGLGTGISAQAEQYGKLIPKENRIILEEVGIKGSSLDFSKVNFEALDDKFKESFKEAIKNLNDEIEKGIKQKFKFDIMSEDQKKSIREADEQVKRIKEKAEASKRFNVENSIKDLNKFAQAEQTWVSNIANISHRTLLTIAQRTEEDIVKINKLTGQFGVGPDQYKRILQERRVKQNMDTGRFDPTHIYASEQTLKIQKIVDRIKRPSAIQVAEPGTEFANLDRVWSPTLERYTIALHNYQQAARSWTWETRSDIEPFADALENVASEFEYFSNLVDKMQWREDRVNAFVKSLTEVEGKLKGVDLTIEASVLFASDPESFKNMEVLAERIKLINNRLKETSGASGHIDFVERIKDINASEVTKALINIEAIQTAEKNRYSPQDAAAKVAERVSFPVKPDVIRSLPTDFASMDIRKELAEFEKLQAASKNFILATKEYLPFLKPTDLELFRSGFANASKMVLDKQNELKDKIHKNSNDIIRILSLADLTGTDISPATIAAIGVRGLKARDLMMQELNKAKDALKATELGVSSIPPGTAAVSSEYKKMHPVADPTAAYVKAATDVYRFERRLQESIPPIKSFSDSLSQLSTYGLEINFEDWYKYDATELNNLIKKTDELAEVQRKLAHLGSREVDPEIRKKQSQDADETKRANARRSLEMKRWSATDMLQAIGTAGAQFNIKDISRISSPDFKNMILEAEEYAKIQQILGEKDSLKLPEEQLRAYALRVIAIEKNMTEQTLKYRNLSFNERLQDFSSAGLTIDLNTYFRLKPETIESYTQLADEINVLNTYLNMKDLSADAKFFLAVQLRAKKYDAFLENLKLENYTNKLSAITSAFGDLNIQGNEFAVLSVSAKIRLGQLADEYRDATEVLTKMGVEGQSSEAGKEANAAQVARLEEARKLMKAGRTYNTNIVDIFNQAGISVDKAAANLISASSLEKLKPDLNRMKKISGDLNTPGLVISEAARIAAQAEFDALEEGVVYKVKLLTMRPQELQSYKAGESFASSMSEAFSTAFKDSIQSGESTWQKVLSISHKLGNTFVKKITDTYIDGMVSTLFKPTGILDTLFKSIGSTLFSGGANSLIGTLLGGPDEKQLLVASNNKLITALESLKDSILRISGVTSSSGPSNYQTYTETNNPSAVSDYTETDIATPIEDSGEATVTAIKDSEHIQSRQLDEAKKATGALGNLSSLFGNSLIGNVLSGVNAVASTISSVGVIAKFMGTGAAEGGAIQGPGTGTSDSIPIMVSNNEFIINAKAAFKHRGLLEAINNNRLGKYATGGSVLASSDAMSLSLQDKTSNQQVFNINITGDISRQTRSEIQRMIPNIAVGVNAHNKERGNR